MRAKSLPKATIYVLNGLLPGQAPAFAELNARPVLGSTAEITEWCGAMEGQRSPGAALHVDTGMNRLGLSLDEARYLTNDRHELLSDLKPDLLMTHMACADLPDSPLNTEQRENFEAAIGSSFPACQPRCATRRRWPGSRLRRNTISPAPAWRYMAVK
jgi:alanine racemase